MSTMTGHKRGQPHPLRLVVSAIIVFCTYFFFPLLAPAGLSYPEFFLLQGIPLGIAVGLATRGGGLYLPFLAVTGGVTTVYSNMSHGDLSSTIAVPLGLLVLVEILAISFLLRRSGAYRLDHPKHVAWMLGIMLALVIPAAIIASTLLLSGGILDDYAGDLIRSWILDDLYGLALFTPMILLVHRMKVFDVEQVTEYGLALFLSLLASAYLFNIVQPGQPGIFGWPYVILIVPLWVAVRMGAAAVAPANAFVFWFATYSTGAGRGPFTVASPYHLDQVVSVETFSIVMSVTLLTVAVLRDARLTAAVREREAARLVRNVVDASVAPIFAKSYKETDEGSYILVNTAWTDAAGISEKEALGRTDAELFPQAADAAAEHDEEVLSTNSAIISDTNWEGETSSYRSEASVYQTVRFPLTGEENESWGVGGISYDITAVTLAKEDALKRAETLHIMFFASPVPTARIRQGEDQVFHVEEMNDAMLHLLNVSPRDIVNVQNYVHPEDWLTCETLLLSASAGVFSERSTLPQREIRIKQDPTSAEIYVLMSVAALTTGEEKDSPELILQCVDVTKQHDTAQQLETAALYDPTTGVYIRQVFTDRTEKALALLGRNPGFLTVLLCDIDGFKQVNDTVGHREGDLLLAEIGQRFLQALRPGDTVARIGGDEFAILCEHLTQPSDAYLIASRIQDHIHSPWVHDGAEALFPTISIGVAVTDDMTMTVQELTRRADVSMYRAKSKGKDRIDMYDGTVDREIREASRIRGQIHHALSEGNLILHYQPVVRITDGALLGVEALVRMRQDDGTLVPPNAFLPQAELSSQIVPVGAWVLQQAMMDMKRWSHAGHGQYLTVNVSSVQLRRPQFADMFLSTVQKAGIPLSSVWVDVTEETFLLESAKTSSELAALSSAGVKIAVDDYKLDARTLQQNGSVLLSAVKIDRNITALLGTDNGKTAAFTSLLRDAAKRGISVIAVGVETEKQKDVLLQLGCRESQGYLFGQPTLVDGISWEGIPRKVS